MKIREQHGAALPVALFFAVFALILTSVYLSGQFGLHQPALRAPIDFQALLAARSGIWRGLAMLNNQETRAPGAQARDSLDDLFEFGMFDGIHDTASDTNATDALLVLDGFPLHITPFSDPAFGVCTLSLSLQGAFERLESIGAYRDKRRIASALMGSRPFMHSDTVLFLKTPGAPRGTGFVDGRIHFIPIDTVKQKGAGRSRFSASPGDMEEFINGYKGKLSQVLDSAIQNLPLTISGVDQLPSIPENVNGPLIIDGSYHDIVWKEDRTIQVMNDLQFTGDVLIEDVTFIVGGETKIFDKARLKNVSIFSQKSAFVADESEFEGSLIAIGNIEMYGEAKIRGKSLIVGVGPSSTKAETKAKQGDEQSAKSPFAVYLRDRATADAAILSLHANGGLFVGADAQVRGVAWSESRACIEGRIEGVVRANVLCAREDPGNGQQNTLNGVIKPLETIADYHLPFFIGELSILTWNEE
jgi:hypothetical protein